MKLTFPRLKVGKTKNANKRANPKWIALAGKPLNIPKIKQSPGLNDVVRKRLDFLQLKPKEYLRYAPRRVLSLSTSNPSNCALISLQV